MKRCRLPGTLLLLVSLLFVPLPGTGCRRGRELPAGPEAEAFSRRRGRTLFHLRCAACHGTKGEGDGLGWPDRLPGRPADLTGAAGSDHSSIAAEITADRPGRLCPRWDIALTSSQVRDLAIFIQAGLPGRKRE